MKTMSDTRLDAAESAWFQRELEYIDRTVYETIFPDNKARELIPTQQGVPDWAKVYTWRMFEKFGRAKIAANMADDIPRADVTGREESKIIKVIPSSYGWDIFEIKASRANGTKLDALKAMAARLAIETGVDEVLALGSANDNLDGLLTLTGTTPYTLADKAAGGKTWAVATSDEIAADLFGAVTTIKNAMKNAGGPGFSNFTVVLPVAQHAMISQRRMGDGSDKTILRFVIDNSPFITEIEPWHHCSGAGAMGTDRMVVYPKTPLVLAGIVPMEYTTLTPEQRNLEYVVNAMSTTGGVVVRYPVAIAYGDGL
jgi:hypothetical protein